MILYFIKVGFIWPGHHLEPKNPGKFQLFKPNWFHLTNPKKANQKKPTAVTGWLVHFGLQSKPFVINSTDGRFGAT